MVSLDQINKEAETRFKPFVIEGIPGGDVVLRNAMRLPKAERAQLRKLHAEVASLKDGGADENAALAVFGKFFALLAIGDAGKRLADAVGDDPAKLMILLEMYAEDTQLGEALRSPR